MNRESGIRLLVRLRRSRASLGRALLALFTVAWLGLALQPCVAQASHAHGAPASAEHSGHGGCGGEPQPAPDCPHCLPGSQAGACGTALDCGSAGAPAPAVKAADAPRADVGAWIDLPLPAPDTLPDGTSLPAPDERPAALVAPRSLLERYCTHLE
jgi:hypothetical protein